MIRGMRNRASSRRCNPSWIQVADRLTGNEARRLAEKYERMGYAARITGTSSFTLLVMKTNRAKKFWSEQRGNPDEHRVFTMYFSDGVWVGIKLEPSDRSAGSWHWTASSNKHGGNDHDSLRVGWEPSYAEALAEAKRQAKNLAYPATGGIISKKNPGLRCNPGRFTSVQALTRAVSGAVRRAGERYLDDSVVAMRDGGFFSCRPAHVRKFTTALAKFGIVYRTKAMGKNSVTIFYDAKDNVTAAGYRRAGLRGELRKAAKKVGVRYRRRNPDVEALSWPTAWGTGGKSKKDFKAYVAAYGGDAEVMCHGMRSVPGSLRDLPRKRYVVYGGTSNPNQIPAKWYATLDLTGPRPKVS